LVGAKGGVNLFTERGGEGGWEELSRNKVVWKAKRITKEGGEGDSGGRKTKNETSKKGRRYFKFRVRRTQASRDGKRK